MTNSRSGLFGIFLCVIAVFGLLALLRPTIPSVGAEELKVRTMEERPSDTPKVVPLGDPLGDKDVEVTKLSAQVYRVDVKATVEGRAAYEKEWVKFCSDHPTAKCSPAPPDGKGNMGTAVLYWNVDEK